MKKAWIIPAIIAVLICVLFVLLNRDDQLSSEVTLMTEKTALSDTQVQENNGFGVSGKVIDGLSKKPLAAKIKLKKGDQIIAAKDCNAAGEFAFLLEDGNYEFLVEHPHYVSKGKYDENRWIEIDGEPVKLNDTELWPESIVKGRVVLDNQGIEAELQFIYQKDNSGAKHYLFNTIKNDKDGYFTLDHAYGGVQDIRITSDNLLSQKLSDIALTPGKTIDLGEIPMKPGLTVFGVVKEDGTDKGISKASVFCVDSNRSIVAETETANDGSYTLPVIDQRNYRILVSADGFHSNSAFLETQNQNRYEHNVAMTKLPEKKPAQDAAIQPPEYADNNNAMDEQNDESENELIEAEILVYKDKIKNIVHENLDQIEVCYHNLLAIEAASGQVVFNFLSSSSGDVFDIKINNAEINNEEFLNCLTDVIANFHLPQRSGDGLVMIEYPFSFEHN